MKFRKMLPLLIVMCLYRHSARADFRIQGAQTGASDISSPTDISPGQPSHRRRVSARIQPRVVSATGFGRQIPLSFALRQIVPTSLQVSFAPEVDQDALVDWSGGRPWNQVIAAVVQPLHLRAVVTPRGVLIVP